jgi:capsular exopolysaccharide synthesis family protein
MSRFFKAMQEAARESGEVPPILMPDVTRFNPVAPQADIGQTAEAATAEPLPYRRVVPRPISSKVLPPLEGPYLRVADQYRIIRTKIVQHPAQPRLLSVASAGIGDGKTLSAINIAGALAMKAGASVLLIDADFRRPRVAEALGIDHTPGLADVLRGDVSVEDAILQIEAQTSLFVLPAGEAPPNPTELLDTPQWGLLARTLRDRFDYVIVDAPPIGLVADYDLIQAAVDGVILIARVDHSSLAQCLRASKAVPKQKLLGIVMNAVPDWFLTRSSIHDYGYYRRGKKKDLGLAKGSAVAGKGE